MLVQARLAALSANHSHANNRHGRPLVSPDLILAASRQHEGKNHRDRCSLSPSGLVAGLLPHDIVTSRPTIA